jgi:hypothetical protein
MKIVSLEQLTFESFAGLLKTKFRIALDAEDGTELELSELTPPQTGVAGGANGQTYENFSLIFLGTPDRVLPQKIYTFESAQLGRFELFIVPIARDQNGTRYQAIFSRLVKPS